MHADGVNNVTISIFNVINNNWFMLLAVHQLWGTQEVWKELKKLEIHSALS